MFVIFSNQFGCIGSLLVTILGTLILLALLGWINLG